MSSPRSNTRNSWTQRDIVLALTVIIFAVAAATLSGFASTGNLVGLLQSVATLGMLGLGMGMIVIARGIDLSMIATLSVPPALVLQMVQSGYSAPSAFLVALLIAILVGALNGWLIAYAEMPALFATLATGLLLFGVGTGMFFSNDIIRWPDQLESWSWIGRGQVFGVPMPVLIFFVVTVLFAVLLGRTRIGRFVYALGDNPQGARIIGIPVRPTMVLIFIISSVTALVAGIVTAAALHTVALRVYNSTLIYDVILVVVLGGIGLSGGRGGVTNVLVGTMLIGTLTNILTLLNADVVVQNLVKGGLLLVAIVVDSRLNPRNEETAQQGDI